MFLSEKNLDVFYTFFFILDKFLIMFFTCIEPEITVVFRQNKTNIRGNITIIKQRELEIQASLWMTKIFAMEIEPCGLSV